MRRWLTRRGLTRLVFEALLLVQVGHLAEHLVQISQIHLLGWPPPQARGLIAAFDVETMHFVWNVAVLATVGWLLRHGVRSTTLVMTFVWAAAHTVEHGYLVTHAMLIGREGGPGLLGSGGLLASLDLAIPGLTTWTRPTVHLVWNVGEVLLLVLAYVGFAWPWLPRASRRALTLTPGAVAAALAALVLAFSATRAEQPVTALAPFDVIVDGRNELVGVAVAADDALYLSDRGAGAIYRLTSSATLTTVAVNLDRPAGLAVAFDGRLLIVEEHAGRILRLERNGSLTVVATGLKTPRFIVVNDDDTAYVSAHRLTSPDGMDRSEARVVVRVDMAAGTIAEVATGIRSAQGLARVNGRVGVAVDALASAYVASKELTIETDTSKRAIGKVHPGARLTDFAANLADPQGVALGHDGALYVADGKSGRLYRFRPPPAPTLGTLPEATRQPSLAVVGTTEARSKVDVFVDDATQATSSLADTTGHFALDVALSPNRLHRLHVYATTHAGDGLTSPAATAQIIHDDQPPSVAFSAPPAGMHVRGAVNVSSVARDDGSGVASVTLGAAGQALAPALDPVAPAATVAASAVWDTRTTSDGAQTLSVRATDLVGNESPGVTRSVIVDNTAPETALITGPEGDSAVTLATFTFSGSDAITAPADLTFSWRLDGGAWSAFAPVTSVTLIDLAEGQHVFEVKARDRAGNEDLVRPATLAGVTTTVPISATSGPIVVTTPRGAASGLFTVSTTGDFGFTALPPAATSLPGAQVSYALSVVGSGAFTGLVSVGVSGLPAGVTAEFVPGAFLAPGQTGELRLRLAADVAAGTTQLMVAARGVVDGIMRSQVASLMLTIGAPGQTAVAGRFVLTTGEPLEGVGLAIGAAQTATDAAGNFILLAPPTGRQILGIDANRARAGLPIYATDVTVTLGEVTVLPTAWLTAPPPPERFVPIANATSDQVIADARFPGVTFTLPAGVTITGWDGILKTRIAIERILQDKLPVPPPPGRTRSLFQLFFGTPMGGVPSSPLPVTLPNDLGLEPGGKAQLWYYDAAPLPGAAAAWRLAGLGTVSTDGQTIASDPGVGIARFCGVCGLSCFIENEDSQPSADEGTPEDGEPVNLAIGQHLVDAVDLLQPGRIPAVVYRRYNPFDAFGRIAGFELFLGQGWALSLDIALLDVNQSLRRLVMPGNARYEFARQSDGRFVNRTNPRFRGATISEEADGVQALRFSNGNVWGFRGGWIGRGRTRPIVGLNLLIEQRDRHDNVLTISRDGSGGVASLTQPDGRTISFTTSLLVPGDQTSARLTQVRDALGRTVQYAYDPASRRLQSVTDAAGGETRYAYDVDGRLLSIRDQKGVTYVKNQYDAQGRVSAQEMADGGLWRYAYDGPVGAHSVVRVTNPRGHTTTHRMGAGGRGDEVVDALGQSTHAQRDGTGLASAVTDALGRTTRIEYDAARRPSASVDREGNRWSFTYESVSGNVEKITDPLGNMTRFESDATGNLTARVNPEGDRLEFGYDGGGAPTTVTDALGRTRTSTYDAAGNVTAIRDPVGNTATFEHDAGSRLVKAIDPKGAVTRWFHDALNRVTQIVDPGGGVSTFTYNAKGNLLALRDARGNTTTYTYDDMDRRLTRTDALGRTKTFTYDLNGNVVRTVDANDQTTHHEYDALNRRIRTAHADGSAVEYFYDAIGRLIRTTDTDGGTILMTYDAQDRLTEEITAQGVIGYAHDVLGRRRSVSVDGRISMTYDYDRNSRLKTLTQSGWGTATLDYFITGQLQRRTLPNRFSTRYEYDDTGRVTRLVYERMIGAVLGDLTYGYDMAGRRTTMGGSLARTLLPDSASVSSYDVANQQLLFGNYTSTYDRNGNVTSVLGPDGFATLVWDARDRLRGATRVDATLTFDYDGLGRRSRRIADDGVSSYQYAGGDVVRENRGGLELPYLRGLVTDETLGQERSLAYMIDGVRSTIGLVDDAGDVAQTFAYEPFGRADTSGSAERVRYQFTGRERDADWLYYYRARYYNPRLARFLQPDPLGLRGEANPYAYAINNPIANIDPSGLRTYIAHGCCNPNMTPIQDFRTTMQTSDPDIRFFNWSSKLFFDVIPSSKTPSDAMLQQILRDLQNEPLQPGEKLNLIGHSAGGIIINNVSNALRASGIAVDNMITFGTPLFPGTINAALPPDVQVTNFTAASSGDVLANTLSGPNVINVPVVNMTAEGTRDFLTAHTGYWNNAMVISVVQQLIKP